MQFCPICGKLSSILTYHFEKGHAPTKYVRCTNSKCRRTSKETNTSYEEINRRYAVGFQNK